MPVKASKTDIGAELESILDKYEEYIPEIIWDDLVGAYAEIDDLAEELQRDLESADEALKDLQVEYDDIKSRVED